MPDHPAERPQKPVGTVAVAVSSADGATRARTFSLYGSRSMIKFQAAQMGLDMVRRILQETSPEPVAR